MRPRGWTPSERLRRRGIRWFARFCLRRFFSFLLDSRARNTCSRLLALDTAANRANSSITRNASHISLTEYTEQKQKGASGVLLIVCLVFVAFVGSRLCFSFISRIPRVHRVCFVNQRCLYAVRSFLPHRQRSTLYFDRISLFGLPSASSCAFTQGQQGGEQVVTCLLRAGENRVLLPPILLRAEVSSEKCASCISRLTLGFADSLARVHCVQAGVRGVW